MTRACIIGTAGHIDHGKTLLIKMLTGVDTDRLKEEKERGISIELGFASLTTPSGVRCGVVDVPGHERFIRNMLAGAGGIDLILLVIAADEGVMPQTREHLDIVDLLGARDGVVAVTKIDMVEPDWRDLVIEDIRSYLAQTCLSEAPIVPVSSVTGEGREELLAAIDAAVARADLSPRGKFTRLPIDRVFTLQGFGTVVTGTLWAGELREGDRIRIEPKGIDSRIKSLEVHGERVERAIAGQRVAVSIHGVEREASERGDWLIAGSAPPMADLLQARMRCVQNSPYAIKNRLRVRFHLGASEVIGRAVPLDAEEIPPGSEGFVEIRLEASVPAERGDRFVLRSFSPMRTLGGGVIVDVSGHHRRRFRDGDLAALRLAAEGSIEERVLGAIVQAGMRGFAESELAGRLGQPAAEVAAAVGSILDQGGARRLGRGILVARESMDAAGMEMAALLEEHQKRNPLQWGILKSEVKSRLEKRVHPEVVESWIQERQAAGELHVRGDRLRLGEARIVLPPALQQLRERVRADLDARGFAAPSFKELADAIGPQRDLEELLNLLIAEGELTRIPPDLIYPSPRIEEMRSKLREIFARGSEMSVAVLKDALAISRKQAVPLLEYFDRQRWTERRGDLRVAGPRLSDSAGPSPAA